MIVKFTPTKVMRTYSGPSGIYTDGQTRELDDDRAKYLTETFPKNFTVITSEKAKAEAEAKEKAEAEKAKKEEEAKALAAKPQDNKKPTSRDSKR